MTDGTVNNAHLSRVCDQCARCSAVVADDGDVAGVGAIFFFLLGTGTMADKDQQQAILYTAWWDDPKMLSRGETVELSLGCSRGQRLELNDE
jgi:hypothetical protein